MNAKRTSISFWFLGIIAVLVFLIGTFFLHKIFPSSTKDSIENKEFSVEKTTTNVKISNPKGGEVYTTGDVVELKWSGGEERINIFLIDKALEAQGVSVSLVDRVYDIKNEGHYEYTFSKKMPSGTYKFEIGNASTGYFNVNSI